MSDRLVDRRDLQFLLFEMFEAERLTDYEYFEDHSSETFNMALDTAYQLFRDRDEWLSPARRIEILRGAAALMQERREELAIEAAREGGKPLMDSLVEVDRAVDGVHECVEFLRTQHGDEVPMLAALLADCKTASTSRPSRRDQADLRFRRPSS